MFPRLVFASLLLMVVAGAGFGVMKFIDSRRPIPRAAAMLSVGDAQSAQLLLRPLVKAEPRNAAAHVLLGRTQLELSDTVAAEKEFKIARALRYDRAVVNPLLARAYLMQGRYGDVLADIPATAVQPEELVANLVARSLAYLKMNDAAQAQASIDAAHQVAPDNVDVRVTEARLYYAKGDAERGLAAVDAVLETAPRTVDAWMLKGEILGEQGRTQDALAATNKAVALTPAAIAPRLQRAYQYMALNQDKGALEDITLAFGANWHENTVYVAYAQYLIKTGKYADATVELQKLMPYIDDFPQVLLMLAQAGSAQDQNESSLDFAYRYLKVKPGDTEALRLAAEMELRLGRPVRAVTLLTRGDWAGPKDAAYHDLLGRAYFAEGHVSDAIESYGRATQLDSANTVFAAHLAAAQKLSSTGAGLAARTSGGEPVNPAP